MYIFHVDKSKYSLGIRWTSWLGLQNTPTASLQKGKTPPNKSLGYDAK